MSDGVAVCEVIAVDVGCDACQARMAALPPPIATHWIHAHRTPALLRVHLLVNGRPTSWLRRSSP